MEVVAVAVFGALTNSLAAKLLTLVDTVCVDRGKASEVLKDNIYHLERALGLIYADMQDQLSCQGQPNALKKKSMEEFHALAHSIEDCLDQFLPCAACGEKQIHRANKFRDEIAGLRKKLDGAHDRKKIFDVPNQSSTGAKSNVDHRTYQHTGTYEACSAVGMKEPMLEVCRSLVDGEATKLRVVSIVGFGGSGKTALAWAVYDSDEVNKQFTGRAWGDASKHEGNARGLLTDILKGLLGAKAQPVPEDVGELQQHISQQLETKRCLVVIDDVNVPLWDNIIKPMLPKKETESRILVTTTGTKVANFCCFHGGYIYNMRSLSVEQSKEYIDKEIFHGQPSEDMNMGSIEIANRCGGHPLTLVSVAKDLQGHGPNLKAALCTKICKNLCSRIDKNENGHFTKLAKVLTNNYLSLPDDSLKTCLLYASLFPNGGPVSRKTITRRWLAEGYVDGDLKVADEKFEELIERNVIRPIDTSNNGDAKTCKTQSIMHQFMLHKSMSSNFIARSFGAQNRSNFRHLVIGNNRNGTTLGMDHDSVPAAKSRAKLSNFFKVNKKVATIFKKSVSKELRPRSLTIFGRAEEAVYSDITNLQLLRVLDLKECSDIQDGHLEKIYELLHLKYLSLGRSITDLPDDGMKKLHRLQTLDLRNTMIQKLPLEIIILPHLEHLFGKIKLNKLNGSNLDTNLLKKGKLQTVAGVVIDNNSGFPELMGHMKQLKKVKIWCETTSIDTNYTILSKAIREFGKAGMGTAGDTYSLSLHLNDSPGLLNHRQGDNANAPSTEPEVLCYLSSFKLHGRPSQFEFFNSMCGLRELCLTSTDLVGPDLSALNNLEFLLCLKLVQDNLKDLCITPEDFKSLQRLCLVLKEPRFPTIAENALPHLISIQLLCGGLDSFGGIKMENFKHLCEVALDSAVHHTTVKLWEGKAKEHPKRPKIVLLKRVDPADTRSAVKYVATDPIPSEPQVQGIGTNQIPSGPPVQEITTDQIPSGPPVHGIATDQISLGLVQGVAIDQIISRPLVQGISTNGVSSGRSVQAMA